MDVVLLTGLIVLNGLFAMVEIALVSSRKARLQKLADSGSRRAKAALKLRNDPSTFLATVQVGITAVGILSGAIGETALADPLAAWLTANTPLARYAKPAAVTAVVLILTYFSVVVGELVPKQLGLRAPEKIASLAAAPMNVLSFIARPLVWLLSSSSRFFLRLTGKPPKEDPPVTGDEINVLMAQGAEAGVFHEQEEVIVSNVLQLAEQRVGTIMTYRSSLHGLDLKASAAEIRECLEKTPFSHVVVCRGGLDNVAGVLNTCDALRSVLRGENPELEKLLETPIFVPENATVARLLKIFREQNRQCALVVDEYGGLQGLVTLPDVLDSIVGNLSSPSDPVEQDIVRREDGSLLVDGDVPIEKLRAALGLTRRFPGEAGNAFNTIGGFIMHKLERIPKTADHFHWNGWRFEVVDMDRNRIDKVMVSRQP